MASENFGSHKKRHLSGLFPFFIFVIIYIYYYLTKIHSVHISSTVLLLRLCPFLILLLLRISTIVSYKPQKFRPVFYETASDQSSTILNPNRTSIKVNFLFIIATLAFFNCLESTNVFFFNFQSCKNPAFQEIGTLIAPNRSRSLGSTCIRNWFVWCIGPQLNIKTVFTHFIESYTLGLYPECWTTLK